MKAVLTDESTRIFSEPNEQAITLTTLQKGIEVELGKVTKKKKEVWVEVTLLSGQIGYIPGDTKIFAIKKVQLLNNSVDMLDAPIADATVVKTYAKNAIFTAIGIEKEDDKGWVRVRDDSGLEGYIPGAAKIKVYQEPTKSGGKKLMITGGIFASLGIVIFVVSLFQVQSATDSPFLMIALLALGFMQVVQGYLQYRKASKTENEPK